MRKQLPLKKEVLLSEVLEQCRCDNRTGLLNITVVQSALFPLRIYLEAGEVTRFSFGPLNGRECLELLPYYDLGLADYLDGMRAPREGDAMLATGVVIDAIRNMGKTIRMKRWVEREVGNHAEAV